MGINPYGEPGVKVYKQQMRASLGLNKTPSNSLKSSTLAAFEWCV